MGRVDDAMQCHRIYIVDTTSTTYIYYNTHASNPDALREIRRKTKKRKKKKEETKRTKDTIKAKAKVPRAKR